MKINTQQLTRGAMVCALYAILLFLNQQTALTLENTAPWLFIFPIMLYAAQTTVYAAVVCALAMFVETFLFGSFTTWFYSWTALLSGLAAGICIQKKLSGGIQTAVLFVVQFIGNILILFLWASLFGMDYQEDFALVRAYIPWLNLHVFLLLMAGLLALITAICVHLVGQAICLRLHIPVPPLKKVSQITGRPIYGWLFVLSAVLFILLDNVVLWGIDMKNALLVILIPLAVLMDYYGTVSFMNRCVRRGKRSWAPVAVAGAFVPGLNMIWILAGMRWAIRRGK